MRRLRRAGIWNYKEMQHLYKMSPPPLHTQMIKEHSDRGTPPSLHFEEKLEQIFADKILRFHCEGKKKKNPNMSLNDYNVVISLPQHLKHCLASRDPCTPSAVYFGKVIKLPCFIQPSIHFPQCWNSQTRAC